MRAIMRGIGSSQGDDFARALHFNIANRKLDSLAAGYQNAGFYQGMFF